MSIACSPSTLSAFDSYGTIRAITRIECTKTGNRLLAYEFISIIIVRKWYLRVKLTLRSHAQTLHSNSSPHSSWVEMDRSVSSHSIFSRSYYYVRIRILVLVDLFTTLVVLLFLVLLCYKSNNTPRLSNDIYKQNPNKNYMVIYATRSACRTCSESSGYFKKRSAATHNCSSIAAYRVNSWLTYGTGVTNSRTSCKMHTVFVLYIKHGESITMLGRLHKSPLLYRISECGWNERDRMRDTKRGLCSKLE